LKSGNLGATDFCQLVGCDTKSSYVDSGMSVDNAVSEVNWKCKTPVAANHALDEHRGLAVLKTFGDDVGGSYSERSLSCIKEEHRAILHMIATVIAAQYPKERRGDGSNKFQLRLS